MVIRSDAEALNLSFERRRALAEHFLSTTFGVIELFGEELPHTHEAFIDSSCEAYGADATEAALARLTRPRLVH